MKIKYYYSDGCKCCKDYLATVVRVAAQMDVPVEVVNVEVVKADRELNGVPSVYLVDDNGEEISHTVGNLKGEYLFKELYGVIY